MAKKGQHKKNNNINQQKNDTLDLFLEFSLYFLIIGGLLYLGRDYVLIIINNITNFLLNNILVLGIVIIFIILNLRLKEKAKPKNEDEEPNRPQSWIGKLVVNTGIPRYENNIIGFVFAGAAFLVIVIGLRGLGKAVPSFLAGSDGRLDVSIILTALIIEFIMISILAVIMFFKPENEDQKEKTVIQRDYCSILSNLLEEIDKNKQTITNDEQLLLSKISDSIEEYKNMYCNESHE